MKIKIIVTFFLFQFGVRAERFEMSVLFLTDDRSNKTDNKGVKAVVRGVPRSSPLPVCIIQGPPLAAVSLAMKAA